jgi:hypothetical protein
VRIHRTDVRVNSETHDKSFYRKSQSPSVLSASLLLQTISAIGKKTLALFVIKMSGGESTEKGNQKN